MSHPLIHVLKSQRETRFLNRKFLPEHLQDVLAYAAKHGYNDILDDAAPLLLAIPLEEVLSWLPTRCVAPWVSGLTTYESNTAAYEPSTGRPVITAPGTEPFVWRDYFRQTLK